MRIGSRVQILENTVLHLLPDNQLIIEDDAVIGPGGMIHGCQIGRGSVVEPGFLRTYWPMVVSLSRPVVSAVIFTFAWTWNNLLWPLLVLTTPNSSRSPSVLPLSGHVRQPVRIHHGIGDPRRLPLVLIFVFIQRRILEGIAGTGAKG